MRCVPVLLVQIHNIHFKELFINSSHTELIASHGNKTINWHLSIYVHLFSSRESRHGAAECLYMLYNSISFTAGIAGWEEYLKFSEQNLKKIFVAFTGQ